MAMHHVDLKSSNIKSAGYDAETQTLQVTFHGGGVYQYAGVPQDEFAALCRSKSPGGHLNGRIKGMYDHTKIGG